MCDDRAHRTGPHVCRRPARIDQKKKEKAHCHTLWRLTTVGSYVGGGVALRGDGVGRWNLHRSM